MQNTERVEFDKQIKVMMGGFPGYFLTDERLEAYWRGLNKMQMSSLIRVVDFVLSEDGPEKIPGVSALWVIYRQLKVRADNRVSDPNLGKMDRTQHLMHLRRMAITSAQRETMPMTKGYIMGWETAPDHLRESLKQKWDAWNAEYGNKPDSYWWPRAMELMRLWGEKNPEEAELAA